MSSKIIQITTDEEYISYLTNEKGADMIVDFRPDKNIALCSLDGISYREVLPLFADFIKDRVDNGHGRPDKIYITYTTEPFLDMGDKVFSQVVEKGFYVKEDTHVSHYDENIECTFINGDLAIVDNVIKYLAVNPLSIGNIKTIGYPLGLLARTRSRLTELDVTNKIADYSGNPMKHFICLNAVPSPHRVTLVTWLHKSDIINKCHWSWLRRKTTQEWEETLENVDFADTSIFDFRKTKELDISLEDLESHFNQDTVSDFYYLTDSLIDIGVETSPAEMQFITEKTWKPYLHGKVSLFLNCQSYYAILKNLGFELYDEIFDYSFDTITNADERQIAYHAELKRISDIPIEELQTKISTIRDKISRNRNHAWNCDLGILPPFKDYPTLLPQE
jgi:hypothetical protein